MTGELDKPETYAEPGAAMQINRDLSEVATTLADVTRRWEVEASKLAEAEAEAETAPMPARGHG